jgi:tetratricopeptide (TPR) repeat protein
VSIADRDPPGAKRRAPCVATWSPAYYHAVHECISLDDASYRGEAMSHRALFLLGPVTLLSFLLAARTEGAAAPIPRPGDTWYGLETPHFEVVSETTKGRTRELAEDLERMVAAVGQTLKLPDHTAERIRVVLLQNSPSFKEHCEPVFSGPCKGLAGLSLSGPFGNTIMMDAGAYDVARTVAYWGLTNALVRASDPAIPLWLNDGLAAFYSSFLVIGSDVRVGRPDKRILTTIIERGVPPLATLIGMTHDSPEYNAPESREWFRAGSWLLTHYLVLGSSERRGQLTRYLALIHSDQPGDTPFRTAFGCTEEAMAKELWQYASRPVMPVLRLAVGDLDVPEPAAPRELLREEALLALAKLYAGSPDTGPSLMLPLLEEARRANPRAADALALHGWVLERTGKQEEANAELAQAVVMAPDRAFPSCLLGESLLEQVMPTRPGATGTADPAKIARARELLERALEAEPEMVPALIACGRTYIAASGEDAARGIARLSQALALAPDRSDAAFYLAQLLIRTGETDRADAVIARHIASSPAARVRHQADALHAQAAMAAFDAQMVHGKTGPAIEGLERAMAGTHDPATRDMLNGAIARARAYDREALEQGLQSIRHADQATALAMLETLVTRLGDPANRERAAAIRDQIKAGASPASLVPGGGAAETTTPVPEAATSHTSPVFHDQMVAKNNSQREADRYNEAVALHNRRDLAGALKIADELAANATTPEVRTSAMALAKRIRARLGTPTPSPKKR